MLDGVMFGEEGKTFVASREYQHYHMYYNSVSSCLQSI